MARFLTISLIMPPASLYYAPLKRLEVFYILSNRVTLIFCNKNVRQRIWTGRGGGADFGGGGGGPLPIPVFLLVL